MIIRPVKRERGHEHPGHEDYDRNQCWCVDQAKIERQDIESNLWQQDVSGLWHWSGRIYFGGMVYNGAELALEWLPEGPAWFWWSQTPAPVAPGDDAAALTQRWMQWNAAYHADKSVFMTMMHQWCVGARR